MRAATAAAHEILAGITCQSRHAPRLLFLAGQCSSVAPPLYQRRQFSVFGAYVFRYSLAVVRMVKFLDVKICCDEYMYIYKQPYFVNIFDCRE